MVAQGLIDLKMSEKNAKSKNIKSPVHKKGQKKCS